MKNYRNNQDPVIEYRTENLVAFRLSIGEYIRKNSEVLGNINTSQDAVQVIKDIIDVIGSNDTDWMMSDEFMGSTEIKFIFNDIVDILALESFMAFLRRLGFNIGDFDGESWDTPGYDSYS